jgi:hypothetical protein
MNTTMRTSEKLGRLNLEIHEVSHQERLVERRLPLKIISHKYTTHMSNIEFKSEWVGSTTKNLTIFAPFLHCVR